ncbi:MAG: hypothetical protein ACFFCD_10315 [Promethearchaeota archaeon]
MNENLPNRKLIFKEQWWFVSAFSAIRDQELKNKISEMSNFAKEQLTSYNEDNIDPKFVPNVEDRKQIVKIAKHLDINCSWLDYVENFDFEIKENRYSKLGSIRFRVRLNENPKNPIAPEQIRSNHMQQIVFRVWFALLKQYGSTFKFEEDSRPYVFTVCSGYTPKNPYIEWIPETINQYKKELGQWIEIYSGQFEDYRGELYERRVENDISNRKSEMHFIKRNSALIYMDPENYELYFIKDEETPNSTGYMMNYVLIPTAEIRTILFAILELSKLIDEDTQNLASKDYIQKTDISLIKADLDKTFMLKNRLQGMLAPFYTALSKSHRQHYTAVLDCAVELFDINNNWSSILEKIQNNTMTLETIFLEKQEQAQERQERILTIVNILLGAGIVFDLLGYIIPEGSLLNLALSIVSTTFLVILAILLLRLYLPRLLQRTKKEEED